MALRGEPNTRPKVPWYRSLAFQVVLACILLAQSVQAFVQDRPLGGVFFLVLSGLGPLSYYAFSKAPPPVSGQKPAFTRLQLGISGVAAFAMLVAAGGNFYAAATIDDDKTAGYLVVGCFWLMFAALALFVAWYAIRNNRRVLGRPFP